MKILYHHRTRGQGVEGVHIKKIAEALEQNGHQVDIIGPEGMNNRKNKILPKKGNSLIHAFVSKYAPEFLFELLEIFYNFIAIKKIQDIARNTKYDSVFERYAIFNWAGVKFAKRNGIPIILEVNYTASTPLYRKRNFFLKPYARWIEKKIFTQADGIIVVSNYLKQQLINMGINTVKIIVLPNAADSDKFNEQISGEKVRVKFNLINKIVIGFVGGFYPWHGVDMLLEAFISVRSLNNSLSLLLVGDGPLKKSLKLKVKSLKLEEKIIFAGRVEHDELPEYIAAFDVAVMPNSNNYGSPMKIYEYMAMGKPVVGPQLGPLEEGITNGVEGILFEQGNRGALEKALCGLMRDEQLRKKMGKSARENVVAKHTWGKNAEEILLLFNRMKMEHI